ncbi:ABC transporter permease [Nocardioides speluncae]|uniref:ABC transporter permease n=1 Tax=Nocardioides speluncae TaxID=2670337 RepID=UPI001F0C04FD|nr:ABC transporter permease [Nocardioides speluncae]
MHLLATPAPTPDWRLAAVVVVLVTAAATASWVARLGATRDQVTAALRAVLQLAVVSVVIAAALDSLFWSLAFVAMMLTVAVVTSARRIDVSRAQAAWVALAVAAGAAPVIGLCLGSGVIPLNGAGVIPMSGIIIGGSMTSSSLTGRRAFDELAQRRSEYEAALALGLPSPTAAGLVIEPTAREALLPGIDQTRTVGLVTLPGAFVGVLLGGGTPLEAGATQLLVLVGLLAAQAVTAAVLLRLVAAGRVVRNDLVAVYPR